jgi:hypothetical protein
MADPRHSRQQRGGQRHASCRRGLGCHIKHQPAGALLSCAKNRPTDDPAGAGLLTSRPNVKGGMELMTKVGVLEGFRPLRAPGPVRPACLDQHDCGLVQVLQRNALWCRSASHGRRGHAAASRALRAPHLGWLPGNGRRRPTSPNGVLEQAG